MGLDPVSSVLELGQSVIERIWPDANKRAEQMMKLKELEQNGDIAELNAHVSLLLGQLKVNEAEAKSGSLFIAGWRPFIGWVGGFSLAYAGVFYPLLCWFMPIFFPTMVIPPLINTGILGTIVTGMLGIGTMRTVDKKNGTDTK